MQPDSGDKTTISHLLTSYTFVITSQTARVRLIDERTSGLTTGILKGGAIVLAMASSGCDWTGEGGVGPLNIDYTRAYHCSLAEQGWLYYPMLLCWGCFL
eukprot:7518-Eustigmatos_ZCMA.PRE.1